jgi:hypothetical protein
VVAVFGRGRRRLDDRVHRLPICRQRYQTALDADARQYAASISLSSRQIELGAVQGLASRAALALAREGRLDNAVEALEQGRGRMLGEALARDRAEVRTLLAGNARERAAAERYLRAAAQVRALESLERQEWPPTVPGGHQP